MLVKIITQPMYSPLQQHRLLLPKLVRNKSTSPFAFQVENQRNTMGIEEKLDIISQLKNVNEVLTYAVMLDLLILVCAQFMIMLAELQKVLCQELKCLCSETTDYSSVGMNCTKNCGHEPLTFLLQ
jgi:hypothetical protein